MRERKLAGKEPYIDFYTGDWMKDQAVSRCAPATRGIWLDLLCAMHDAGRSGKLCGTADELARLARCSAAELSTALTSLQVTEAADVTERNGVFTVINRRMYRKAQEREANRLRQSKHRSQSGIPPPVTVNVTPLSPIDSDSDPESLIFSEELPEVLDLKDFRKALAQWLKYKSERRETYKEQGLKALIRTATKRAESHGVSAVIDAMDRAMGNRWAGWDQPNAFPGNGAKNGHGKQPGPGQRYDPAKPVTF